MAKLFVSYSRRDSVAARRLIEAFQSIEQDVWVDWESIPPAVDWLEQIFRGIEESDAFIFLISPDSLASEVCKVEIARAALNNKRIIPIVLRDVDTKTAPETIRKLNWTFIRETDNFEEGLAKVQTAIELDLDWLEEHRRLQVRALEWHRKKDVSLLLRGRDLRNARHMVATATSKDPPATDLQQTYILHSSKSERNSTIAVMTAGIALIIMAVLSLIAVDQRAQALQNEQRALTNEQLAIDNADRADENRKTAEKNAELARQNELEAIAARQAAEEAESLAEAQRSAARAQIFQTRPGELDTSTLLAIDSLQKMPSDEAEEILRKNISLLPLPVAQASRSGNINSLEFSQDDAAFLTASADGTACLWSAADGEELFCAEGSESMTDATFSPDGQIVVTGDETGLVQIVATETGKVEDEFKFVVPVRDVSIRQDGGLLAVARDDGKITIIDLRTRKESYNLQTSGRPTVSTFSPNGTWLAAGTQSGAVTLWNLNDGRVISGPYHEDGVLALAFSPNSRYIVTGGKDSTAQVAETRSGKVLLQIANENWVRDIAFSPDGLWFVTASDDRRVRVWSRDSGRERLRILQEGIVNEVKISSNGQWIATTGSDKSVRVWNVATGAQILQMPLNASGSVLAFNKDGNIIVAGDQSGSINVWDISSMAAPIKYVQFNGTAGNVRYSPSGDWLVASDENRVWLLDPEPLSSLAPRLEGTPTLQFKSKVRETIFSPDSKLLGIRTDGNEVAVYKIETRSLKTIGVSGSLQALAFSPDGLQLITAGSDGKLQAWNASSSALISDLTEDYAGTTAIAASPEWLTMGQADKLTILDWNGGQTLSEIESLGNHSLLTFSTDGSLLASSNSSGKINIWKYLNGTFAPTTSISKEQAVSMSFNADGSLLAVGTASYAYLIDALTGEEIARIPHREIVNGISFSADGNTLVTASSRALQFWDLTRIQPIGKDNLIEAACRRLTENFSESRWRDLFVNEVYKPLCDNLPVPD